MKPEVKKATSNCKDLSVKYVQLIALEQNSSDDISRFTSQDIDRLRELTQNKYQCDFGCHFNNKTQQDIQNAEKAGKKLTYALIFCIIFMIVEFIGGYMAHSIALMSDALHLLSDCGGIMISVISLWMTQKKATNTLTFGYHRAEIVGALFSVLLIWMLTIWLVFEAIERLINAQDVNGKAMFIVACCGIIVNIAMSGILHQGHDHDHHHHGHSHHHHHHHNSDSASHEIDVHHNHHHQHHNMNVRSAFIHALGDLLQSVGVLIAAALIWYDNERYRIADPICTLIFSVIVVFTTVHLMRDILSVLMESVPSNINTDDILHELNKLTDVAHVHDLHIWNLSMGKPMLSVHLLLKSSTVDSDGNVIPACADAILLNAQNMLKDKFKIHHSTIQMECIHGDNNHCNNSKLSSPQQ